MVSRHTPTAAPSKHQQIWQTVAKIPFGQVASYGKVADLAGLPRRARLVGHALKHAPDDVDIPWHRVVNAQGRIAFPAGSAAYKRQRMRLEREGIVLINGRVDMQRFAWAPSLDELLWGGG